MSQPDTLQRHQQLCDELHQGVLEENRLLRQELRAPGPDMIARKQVLLAKLDESLVALRALPSVSSRDSEALAQLDRARSRILQILQLEKENELLLNRVSSGARPGGAAAPASSLLKKIYSRSA